MGKKQKEEQTSDSGYGELLYGRPLPAEALFNLPFDA